MLGARVAYGVYGCVPDAVLCVLGLQPISPMPLLAPARYYILQHKYGCDSCTGCAANPPLLSLPQARIVCMHTHPPFMPHPSAPTPTATAAASPTSTHACTRVPLTLAEHPQPPPHTHEHARTCKKESISLSRMKRSSVGSSFSCAFCLLPFRPGPPSSPPSSPPNSS